MSVFHKSKPHPPNSEICKFAKEPLNVLITGGTGFIGKPLVKVLLAQGNNVTVLSRRPGEHESANNVTYIGSFDDIESSNQIDVIINLAGEPLVSGRWNAARKQTFIESRIGTTEEVVKLCERLDTKPSLVISGSAVGFYGAHEDEVLTEESLGNDGFPHRLCVAWEEAARPIESMGIRLALLRIGIVLGHDGGTLAEMRKSFDLGISSQLGNGQQYLPWIHLDDLIGVMAWICSHQTLRGPFNGTAPEPVTHKVFAAGMRKQKRTLFHISIPAFALRILTGQAADELLLTGQRVIPYRIQEAGYEFLFPTVDEALDNLLYP